MTWPNRVLMVNPEYFQVEYAINPHMKDASGNLNKVDTTMAKNQWTQLKNKFEDLGLVTSVLDPQPGLPDMVFCANQSFPFVKDGRNHLVLSLMHSEKRQSEVTFFKTWADENNFNTYSMDNIGFEGMGDLLWDYEKERLFGGYGFRTSPEAYQKLESFVGQKITTLELVSDSFYHLDTCLSILNGETAAFVPEAFTPEGIETIKSSFQNLIEIPFEEASTLLACNMCTPNGKDIIIQSGCKKTNEALRRNGFTVHELDTSEFIKSGGSVFCMKLFVPA